MRGFLSTTEGGGRVVYFNLISHASSFVQIRQIYERNIPYLMLRISVLMRPYLIKKVVRPPP